MAGCALGWEPPTQYSVSVLLELPYIDLVEPILVYYDEDLKLERLDYWHGADTYVFNLTAGENSTSHQIVPTSLDGVKYFASGVLVGTSLTVLIPKTFPLFQRQLPRVRGVESTFVFPGQYPRRFLVLGVGGIFMDQFHVNSACTIESGAPR